VETFRLQRDLAVGVHPLTKLAQGLEDARGLQMMFPDAKERRAFLGSIEVHVSPFHGYMWIDDAKGRVVVSADYLRHGEERGIFLDLVHELVHIRQHREGTDLWDERYAYVDRPTEVEAYLVAVEEARALGLGDPEICEYLHVPWTSAEEHARLCKTLGVPYFPARRG
jgi:hypothetical protein